MNNNNTILLFCLVGLTLLASSCTVGYRPTARRVPIKPNYINNIVLQPHNKTYTTVNIVAVEKKLEKTPNIPKLQPLTTTLPEPYIASVAMQPRFVSLLREPFVNNPETKACHNDEYCMKYATQLGVPVEEINNHQLYQFIDSWYGTGYRLGGCDNSGIDCSAFTQKLFEDVYGTELLRTATEQYKNCKRLKKPSEATEGDLVFFKLNGRRRISHVGIFLGNNHFIHSSSSQGVVISNLNDSYWRKRFAGCGRVPKTSE